MSADLAVLGFRVDSSGLATANTRLKNVTESGRQAERGIDSLGAGFRSLKGAIGVAAAALATFSSASAITNTIVSFDQAVKGLQATSRASAADMTKLQEQARLLGATSKFSATQAADAQRFLAMAGFDTAKILNSTAQVLQLATAANIDLAQSADIVSNVLGGLQLPVEQLGRVTDVLAETAASANTDIVQLAGAMKNAAPIATAAGVQIEELSAIIGALSDSGLQAERAGTGVAGIIRQISNVTPTAQAALAKYGLTVADLSIESHGLTGVMKNLNKANLSAGDAITIFGSEAAAAGLIVSAYSDRVALMTERYKGAAGATKQMSDVMNQSLSAGALGVASALGEVALQIGDAGLTGAMKSGMLASTAFIHIFTGMLPAFAEANNLTAEYTNSVNAFGDAMYAVAGFAGIVFLSSITATTTAKIGAIAAEYAHINAMRASGIARATIAASAANSSAVMAAGEVAVSQAKIVSVNASLSQLTAEANLERVRHGAQISAVGRRQSVARMAEIQLARLAITRQLTAAEAQLAAVESAATKATQAKTVATGQLAAAQGVATASSRALGAAAAFAMGPWGLLVGAVALGTLAFISSKSEADLLTSALEEQAGEVDRLTKKYQELNSEGRRLFWTKTNNDLSTYSANLSEVNAKIEKAKQDLDSYSSGFGAFRVVKMLEEEKKKIEASINVLRDLQGKAFDSSMPNNWIDPEDKPKKPAGNGGGGGGGGGKGKEKVDTYAEQIKALKILQDELGKTSDQLFVMREMNKAAGATPEQIQTVFELATAYTAQKSAMEATEKAKADDEAATKASQQAYDSWANSINSSFKSASVLESEIEKINKAMAKGDITEFAGAKAIKQLKEEINDLSKVAASPFDQMVSGSKEALSAMNGMFESGSRDAQKLAVAMQALNLVQAVGAVLNQGNGDPYTAFGRMAAMASMVAALGMSVGSLSGGLTDDSQQNQANQGLNVWGEKSESIANAIDITANATEKLVGINTSMLGALRTMQSGIFAAAGLISRDVVTPTADVSGKLITSNPFGGVLGKLTDFASKLVDPLGIFGSVFNKLLGGESSVTDEGIQIVGDSLSGIIDNVMVQSFQDVKYKKWKFGSTKHKTVFSDISDVVGEQVSMVFASMYDSVLAGATVLGMSQTAIETALNNFQVATTEISLKDLSAEEQQKEIEAVFSQIFDGLAGSVIPFIDQFQRVGEGMGETLSRVAAQVAVTDEAVRRFGFSFADKMVNPEAFAQAADNLALLTGGVDELASKVASFVQFADAETQLAIATDDITRAFAQVGLAVPESSLALWDLMRTLDGTTESGQQQIATLLNLQDAAKNYYSLLEREQDKQKQAAEKAAAEKQALEDKALDTLYQSAKKAADDEHNLRVEAAKEALGLAKEQHQAESDRIQAVRDHTNTLIDSLKAEHEARQQALSDAESAARDAFASEIALVEDLASKRIEVLNKERETVESNISMLTSIADAAKSSLDSIYTTVESNQMALTAALLAARNGDFSKASNLDFGGAFATQDSFSSQTDFLIAQAATANKVAELGRLAGEQKTIEEKTLESLDAQITAIEAQTKQQVDALNAQLDSLLGIDKTILSISESTSAYQAAQLALDSLAFDESMSLLEKELERLDELARSNDEVYQLHQDYYDKSISDSESIRNTALEQLEQLRYIKDGLENGNKASFDELIAEFRLLRQEQQIANAALADNTNATANELRNINFDGIEVRA